MILDAKDLFPDQMAVIESLLSRAVLPTESISLRAIVPPTIPDANRCQLANELRKYFAEVDSRRQSGSPDDEEEILNEALRSVRPGYLPHQ